MCCFQLYIEMEKVNFEAVTEPAKKRLLTALSNLMQEILALLEIVRDE